jgi:NTE family protein
LELRWLGWNPSFAWFNTLTRYFPPYQLDPFDLDPLRDAVTAIVDFDEPRSYRKKLFLSATMPAPARCVPSPRTSDG